MKSILDRTFHYTPSFETDIRKTFARVERERKAEQKRAAQAVAAEAATKVTKIRAKAC
jgi:hypothetical protein